MDDMTLTPASLGDESCSAWEHVEAYVKSIVELDRHIASLQAERTRMVAGFAAVYPKKAGEVFSEWAADSLALATRWKRSDAERRLTHAVAVTTRFPQVLDALAEGELDQRRAEILVESVEDLPEEIAQQITEVVLPKARCIDETALRRVIRRTVTQLDADGVDRRHRVAVGKRRVEFFPAENGMADLRLHLAATDATAIYQRVCAFAKQHAPGDERTWDERRADVIRDLLLNPAFGKITTMVHITVPANTLTRTASGNADAADGEIGADANIAPGGDAADTGEQPAELAGYGAIGAVQARELAGVEIIGPKMVADPAWQRVITDPVSGDVINVDPKTYRPPAVIANYVRARDRHCVFPGCNRPSWVCDLDHRIPYPTGPTTVANLEPLCEHHHRLKHESGWSVRKEDGSYIWTNPAGTEYANPSYNAAL
jgi:hypothetical protein